MLEIQTLRLFIKEIDNDKNEGKLLFIAFIDELSNFMTAFIDVFDGEDIQEIVENINNSLKSFFLIDYPILKIKVERTTTINENNFEMLSTFIDWSNFLVNKFDICLIDEDDQDEYITNLFMQIYKKLLKLDKNYHIGKNNKLLMKLSNENDHYLFADQYNVFIMNNILSKQVYNFNNQQVIVKAGINGDSKMRMSRKDILYKIVRKINLADDKVFGDFELAINIFDNKLGFYAVEKHSKFWFTYANEFNKNITMYDITIAFNLFFEFIARNNLPIDSIQLVRTNAFDMFDMFKDKKFNEYLKKHINFENITEVSNDYDDLILSQETMGVINDLLLTNLIKIGQYSQVANDLDHEYYDISGNFIRCSPRQYIKKYLKRDIIN